jgi:hypothetical protein
MTGAPAPTSTPGEAPNGGAARRTLGRDAAVAAGLPTVLVGLHAQVYGAWIVDDAGITFAYARSVAAGLGPVLQPGADPVEGYSNPAWLALLVVGRWLGLFDGGAWFGVSDLVLFPKLLALACCFGVFLCFYRLAEAVSRSPVTITVVAGALTAAVPSFVIWTTSGLENALLALAVVVLATTLARATVERSLLAVPVALCCGLFAALAALTRPDGLVYVAAYPLAVFLLLGRDELRSAITPVALSVVACAAPVGAYLAWRVVTFGDWLPTTARAKEQRLPSVADLSRPAELVGYTGWLACAIVVGAVAVVSTRPSPTRSALVGLLLVLGLAVLAYSVLAADWMGQYRFATPVWPLAALVTVLALGAVLADVRARTRAVALTMITAAGLLTAVGWIGAAGGFRQRATLSVCEVALTSGYAVNSIADVLGIRDGSFLGVDAGGTALASRLRFVDLAGLTDARIARFWSDGDMAGLRDHVLDRERPTIMRLFRGWNIPEESGLFGDDRLARDYLLFSSAPSGETVWVRHDAVSSPEVLDQARAAAQQMAVLIGDLYRGADGPRWPCGPVVQPTPPGARPLLTTASG